MKSLFKKALLMSLIFFCATTFAAEKDDEIPVPTVIKYIDPAAPNAIASVSVKCMNSDTQEKKDCPAYYIEYEEEELIVGKRIPNTGANITEDAEYYNPDYYAAMYGTALCKMDKSMNEQRKPTHLLLLYRINENGKTVHMSQCELVHEENQ